MLTCLRLVFLTSHMDMPQALLSNFNHLCGNIYKFNKVPLLLFCYFGVLIVLLHAAERSLTSVQNLTKHQFNCSFPLRKCIPLRITNANHLKAPFQLKTFSKNAILIKSVAALWFVWGTEVWEFFFCFSIVLKKKYIQKLKKKNHIKWKFNPNSIALTPEQKCDSIMLETDN